MQQAIIESPNGRERLEITVVEDVGYDERWTVRLETADVTARHGFWSGSGAGSASLVGWCESLAADWRGWNGQREWEAVEHDFKLAASHDGLGHVVLWATLGTVVAPPTNTWLVRVPLTLEAGQLEDLVARVRQLV